MSLTMGACPQSTTAASCLAGLGVPCRPGPIRSWLCPVISNVPLWACGLFFVKPSAELVSCREPCSTGRFTLAAVHTLVLGGIPPGRPSIQGEASRESAKYRESGQWEGGGRYPRGGLGGPRRWQMESQRKPTSLQQLSSNLFVVFCPVPVAKLIS